MSSFSCPHFDMAHDYCLRLKTDCVPGRPGCVLRATSKFAIPVEERLQQEEREKERVKTMDAAVEDGKKR